jgi:hypothetical protein
LTFEDKNAKNAKIAKATAGPPTQWLKNGRYVALDLGQGSENVWEGRDL